MVSEYIFHQTEPSAAQASSDQEDVQAQAMNHPLTSVDINANPIDATGGLTLALRAAGAGGSASRLALGYFGYQFLTDACQKVAAYPAVDADEGVKADKAAKPTIDTLGECINEVAIFNTALEQATKTGSTKVMNGNLTAQLDQHFDAIAQAHDLITPTKAQLTVVGRTTPAQTAKTLSAVKDNRNGEVTVTTDKSSNDEVKAEETARNAERDRPQGNRPPATEKELSSIWRKTSNAIDQAVSNRGRETNAFKSLHDYLKSLADSSLGESAKLHAFEQALAQVSRIKDWDKPQWFRREPSNWRDPAGRRMSEHDFIRSRNDMTREQIKPWDDWAKDATLPFTAPEGVCADEKIAALNAYLVRRVSVDSVKNWLRRRPDETFVNVMFGALAENKLYLDDANLRIRSLKDRDGSVRPVEIREGQMYFEGSEDLVPIGEDKRGRYVELPDDSDMVVFERRTVGGKKQIVPISQPNDKDPNIQWFGGAQVKRGWEKEQRFLHGPLAFSSEELYGFFPDHFPMRVTNSVEAGKPTTKTGAAIYGYARDHAGRQARQLIADYGDVMDGLKRNNSQLINDTRIIYGLQKAKAAPGALEFDSPFPGTSSAP